MAIRHTIATRERSTTTGLSDFQLEGAVDSFQSFEDAGLVGYETHYTIVDSNGNQEVGIGTVGSGFISRDSVLYSTNGNELVDFPSGNKQVYCTITPDAVAAAPTDEDVLLTWDGENFVSSGVTATGGNVSASQYNFTTGTGYLGVGATSTYIRGTTIYLDPSGNLSDAVRINNTELAPYNTSTLNLGRAATPWQTIYGNTLTLSHPTLTGTFTAYISANNTVSLVNSTIGTFLTAGGGNVVNTQGQAFYSTGRGAWFGNSLVSGAALTVSSYQTAAVTSIIQGVASQTANLTEWRNSSGTALVSVQSSGRIIGGVDNLDSIILQSNGRTWITFKRTNDGLYSGGIRWQGSTGIVGWTLGHTTGTQGTDLNLYDATAAVVTFKQGGNVGIGTASPESMLHLSRSNDTVVNATSLYADTLNQIKITNTTTTATTDKVGGALVFENIINRSVAGVASFTDGTNKDTSALAFYTHSSSTDPLERVRISHLGYVGIGDAAPTYKLDVNDDANGAGGARVRNINAGTSAASYLLLGNDVAGTRGQVFVNSSTNTSYAGANSLNILTDANVPIAFHTTNLERMRITGAGNVGIGATVPQAKLDIDGGILRVDAGPGPTDCIRMTSDAFAGSFWTWRLPSSFADTINLSYYNNVTSSYTTMFTILDSYKFGIGEELPGAKLQVSNTAAADKALVIKGFASQTADLMQWQDSTGTVMGNITAGGSVGARGLTLTASGGTGSATITPTAAGGIAIVPTVLQPASIGSLASQRTGPTNNSYMTKSGVANLPTAVGSYIFGLDGVTKNVGMIWERDSGDLSLVNDAVNFDAWTFTKRLTITSAGAVSIGGTLSTGALTSTGLTVTMPTSGGSLSLQDGATAPILRLGTAADVDQFRIYNSSTEWMIGTTANVPVSLVRDGNIGLTVEYDGSITCHANLTADSVITSIVTMNSNDTVAANEQNVLADASAGAITITLPIHVAGKEVRIKKIDSSANAVTVQGATGNIDGAATASIAVQYESLTFVSDGSNWWLV